MPKFVHLVFLFAITSPFFSSPAIMAQSSVVENTIDTVGSITVEADSSGETLHDTNTASSSESLSSSSETDEPPSESRTITVKDSSNQTSGLYSGYSRSQRGGRGISSGGGPSSKKPKRRRIIEDSIPVVTDSSVIASATDSLPTLPQDSTQTFSLHTISTRSKIITGISATAIVGGVITFLLVKKVREQITEPLPLPEPPPPPDF